MALMYRSSPNGMMKPVVISLEVMVEIRNGQKINAIKELRACQDTYFPDGVDYTSSCMGLREAKEIVEQIADTLYPMEVEQCQTCKGTGVIKKYNKNHPFYHPAVQ